MPMTPRVPFTPATLAREWGCSETHVRNLINKGELKASRLGLKLLRIRPEWADEYLDQRIVSPGLGEGGPSPSTKTDNARNALRLERQIARKHKKSSAASLPVVPAPER